MDKKQCTYCDANLHYLGQRSHNDGSKWNIYICPACHCRHVKRIDLSIAQPIIVGYWQEKDVN